MYEGKQISILKHNGDLDYGIIQRYNPNNGESVIRVTLDENQNRWYSIGCNINSYNIINDFILVPKLSIGWN